MREISQWTEEEWSRQLESGGSAWFDGAGLQNSSIRTDDNWKNTIKRLSSHSFPQWNQPLSGLKRGRLHREIDGGMEWEAQLVVREDRERWSGQLVLYEGGMQSNQGETMKYRKELKEKGLKKRVVVYLKSCSTHCMNERSINDGRSSWLKSHCFMGMLLSLFSDWLCSPHISHYYWWHGMFDVYHWEGSSSRVC